MLIKCTLKNIKDNKNTVCTYNIYIHNIQHARFSLELNSRVCSFISSQQPLLYTLSLRGFIQLICRSTLSTPACRLSYIARAEHTASCTLLSCFYQRSCTDVLIASHRVWQKCTYMPDSEENESRREQQRKHITKGRECERHFFLNPPLVLVGSWLAAVR